MLYFLKTGYTNVRRYRVVSLARPMAEYFSEVRQEWVESEYQEGLNFLSNVTEGKYVPIDSTAIVGTESGKKFIVKENNRGGLLIYSPCVESIDEVVANGAEWIPIGELDNPWTQIGITNLIKDGHVQSVKNLVT